MKKNQFLINSCVGIGILMQSISVYAENKISIQDIYDYANQENIKELKKLKDSINLTDSDGNTALCKTILNNNYKGYNSLKNAGANTKPNCIKKIPTKTYDEFIETLSNSSKSGTFLGMGKLGWGITGAVVAGVAVAAGGGGGGGGGGSGENNTSGNNSSQKNLCGGVQCASNSQCVNNICVCNDGYGRNSSGACVKFNSTGIVLKEASLNNKNLIYSHYDYSSVIGLKGSNSAINSKNGSGYIHIDNYSDSSVEGINGDGSINAETLNSTNNSTGTIYISSYEFNGGNIYGMNGAMSLNSYANGAGESTGTINIIGDAQNIYGMKGAEANVKGKAGTGNGKIYIDGETGTIWGIYSDENSNVYNAYSEGTAISKGDIKLEINTSKNAYGIQKTNGFVYNSYVKSNITSTTIPNRTKSEASIYIKNTGTGNLYGIYSDSGIIYNAFLSAYEGSNNPDSQAKIEIISNGGNSYGLYQISDYYVYNAYSTSNSQKANVSATINIKNLGNGYAFGIYAPNSLGVWNSYYAPEAKGAVNSDITILNSASGNAIGIYGKNIKTTNDSQAVSAINISNLSDGKAIGLYSKTNGQVIANGNISITATEGTNQGTAIGIYGENNSNITNSGTIKIDKATKGFGIYAKGNGGSIINSGTIDVSATNAYGIYVENGTNTTVSNTGTIKLNGTSCSGDCSGTTTNGNYIVLNGGTLLNNGVLSAQSLNTNSLKGTLSVGKNAQFDIQNDFDGYLNLSTELVSDGFDTSYVNEGMIKAGDTSRLNLVSESALFDAKLADNGSDVIMKMKSFDSVIENNSLAQFLANNYTLGNNETFFSKLKSFENISSLNKGLDKIMGKDVLSRFNFEDMTMMRELNFDLNNNLFHNKEQQFSLAGTVSPMAFKGDTGSSNRYSLTNKRDGAWSVGLGIAFTDVRSDEDHNDNNHSESMYQMIVPIGYKANGFNLITSPRIGYARGNYDRTGFNDMTYDGTLEKRVFGLMNEARYPLQFGEWTLEPATEFNILGYRQKGYEDSKEFSLNIKSQNTYSVESGIGLYLTKEKDISNGQHLKLSMGLAGYHEFADPYKLELGMNGMDGSFTIYDENRSNNRAVARFGFDYEKEDFTLYGSFNSYIDQEIRSSAKTGFKWKF